MVTSVSYIPSIMFRAAAEAVKCGSSVFVPAGWATIRSPPFFCASAGAASASANPKPIAGDLRSVLMAPSWMPWSLTTAWTRAKSHCPGPLS